MKKEVAKLDRIFSEYIRLRDSDDLGYCTCISCGKVQYWKDVDNGHLINRKHMTVRFNEKNCHAQCRSCNRFSEGELAQYTAAFIDRYGRDQLDILFVQKNTGKKLDSFDLNVLADHYRAEVKKMKKSKTLRDDLAELF